MTFKTTNRPDFVLVERRIVDDPNITVAALGLYTWICDWDAPSIEVIQARFGISQEEAERLIAELTAANLIEGAAS